jgi:hydroxyacylglutathione hydrolase
MILKQIEVGNFSVFAYLVGEAGGDGLVIDPAEESDRILELAKKEKITIRYIVNTHAHVDHIMGNADMKGKTGAQIVLHEGDAPLLTRTPRSMLAMFGGQASPPADRTVKDGDVIQVGSLGLRVLHTPGHSPGGMCLHLDNAVFTGDTLFVGAVGRTDFPGCSWTELLQSIKTKLLTLPDDTIVYPGHNYGPAPSSTIGRERLHNPFLA